MHFNTNCCCSWHMLWNHPRGPISLTSGTSALLFAEDILPSLPFFSLPVTKSPWPVLLLNPVGFLSLLVLCCFSHRRNNSFNHFTLHIISFKIFWILSLRAWNLLASPIHLTTKTSCYKLYKYAEQSLKFPRGKYTVYCGLHSLCKFRRVVDFACKCLLLMLLLNWLLSPSSSEFQHRPAYQLESCCTIIWCNNKTKRTTTLKTNKP